LAGYQAIQDELAEMGVKVYAASIDPEDKTQELTDELSVSYPVGHSATRADGDALGSWWEDRRSIIQPSEFVLNAEGKVVSATYSTGPIGRMEPTDVVKMINFLESKK